MCTQASRCKTPARGAMEKIKGGFAKMGPITKPTSPFHHAQSSMNHSIEAAPWSSKLIGPARNQHHVRSRQRRPVASEQRSSSQAAKPDRVNCCCCPAYLPPTLTTSYILQSLINPIGPFLPFQMFPMTCCYCVVPKVLQPHVESQHLPATRQVPPIAHPTWL